MKIQVGATGILAAAGIVVAGLVLWRVSKAASSAADAAGRVWDSATGTVQQAIADVQSAVANAFSAPPEPGEKAFLYSDAAYTGIDPVTGRAPLDGARADEDFRRFEYEQRDRGQAPAATTTDGAAFGVYPSSGRRRRG